MRRLFALTLIFVVAAAHAPSAVAKNGAAYTAGTIARFNAAGERIEGRVDVSDANQLIFIADRHPQVDEPLRIEYAAIHHAELGQRARRRVSTALGAAGLLGPVGLLALASKHRAHHLTIAYTDEGMHHVVVFELGKSVVRPTLAAVEARSGRLIEYQDEEARKWRR